jgi:hypothetical protein
MLKITPISRLLVIFTIFLSPLSTFAFEGKAEITGCYLANPVKSNPKDAYAKLTQILKNRIDYAIGKFPPNPEREFISEISYMFPPLLFAVEEDTFVKINQLKGLRSKWIKVRLVRQNLYSDLFYFSAKILSTDNKLSKITGLLKLVPIIPIPTSDIKKGDKISLSKLDYQPVSWELIRFATNKNKGIALKKNDLAEKTAETDLIAGNPVYSKRLKIRANIATSVRFLLKCL